MRFRWSRRLSTMVLLICCGIPRRAAGSGCRWPATRSPCRLDELSSRCAPARPRAAGRPSRTPTPTAPARTPHQDHRGAARPACPGCGVGAWAVEEGACSLSGPSMAAQPACCEGSTALTAGRPRAPSTRVRRASPASPSVQPVLGRRRKGETGQQASLVSSGLEQACTQPVGRGEGPVPVTRKGPGAQQAVL